MTIVKHELKQGKNSFLIWTAAIAMLLAVCVFLFPEMKGEMDGILILFASTIIANQNGEMLISVCSVDFDVSSVYY